MLNFSNLIFLCLYLYTKQNEMTTYRERMLKNKEKDFSFRPDSIWFYFKNKELENICLSEYQIEQREKIKNGNFIRKSASTHFSSWNREYQKRLVEFYTKKEDTILDPFAGHSSSFIPFLLERNFKGFEITRKRYQMQMDHIEKLKKDFPNKTSNIDLYNDSSENVNQYIEDESVDVIITDPPFFNLEKYEEAINGTELSSLKSLDIFLNKFAEIMDSCIKKVKENGFVIIKVANFRRNGEFINLKNKFINLFLELGLKQHDEIIIELASVKREPLYLQAVTNLNMLKINEYLLVFRKGNNKLEQDKHNDLINSKRLDTKNFTWVGEKHIPLNNEVLNKKNKFFK